MVCEVMRICDECEKEIKTGDAFFQCRRVQHHGKEEPIVLMCHGPGDLIELCKHCMGFSVSELDSKKSAAPGDWK